MVDEAEITLPDSYPCPYDLEDLYDIDPWTELITSLSHTPDLLLMLKDARDDGLGIVADINRESNELSRKEEELCDTMHEAQTLLQHMRDMMVRFRSSAKESQLLSTIEGLKNRLERLETKGARPGPSTEGPTTAPEPYSDAAASIGETVVAQVQKRDAQASAEEVPEEVISRASPLPVSIPERVSHLDDRVRTLEDRMEAIYSSLQRSAVDAYFSSHGVNPTTLRALVQRCEWMAQYAHYFAGQQQFTGQQQFAGGQASGSGNPNV